MSDDDENQPTCGLDLARAIARCLGIKRCLGVTLHMQHNQAARITIVKHMTVGEMNAIYHEVERFKIEATPMAEQPCEAD